MLLENVLRVNAGGSNPRRALRSGARQADDAGITEHVQTLRKLGFESRLRDMTADDSLEVVRNMRAGSYTDVESSASVSVSCWRPLRPRRCSPTCMFIAAPRPSPLLAPPSIARRSSQSSRRRLGRRLRPDLERVQASRKFVGERVVDGPMTLQGALSLECLGDDGDSEVRLGPAVIAHRCVPRVQVRVAGRSASARMAPTHLTTSSDTGFSSSPSLERIPSSIGVGVAALDIAGAREVRWARRTRAPADVSKRMQDAAGARQVDFGRNLDLIWRS